MFSNPIHHFTLYMHSKLLRYNVHMHFKATLARKGYQGSVVYNSSIYIWPTLSILVQILSIAYFPFRDLPSNRLEKETYIRLYGATKAPHTLRSMSQTYC
uniref:Uncharacterized protein n=1 Tax=Picea glauca TaxID=3330 RepID=A0A101M4E2_PICGL|nr:hypothetical protein ABT39_MTgene573 [Picea glauca]